MDRNKRSLRTRWERGASSVSGIPALNCAEHACFLDVDGTLLDLADSPGGVRVDPPLIHLLEEFARATSGALALISGRPITDIDRLFAPLRLPAAGLHGLELRDASGRVRWIGPLSSDIPRLLALAREWASSRPGLLVEDKSGTFAVHYRNAPRLGDEVHSFMEDLLLQNGGDYCLQLGKMVAEIKPKGGDKGTAIEAFMDAPPFAGRKPVFVGDDVTDEQAFPAVEALGGIAIKVGPGATAARWRLKDVSAVRAWLVRSIALCAGAGNLRA